MTLPYGKKLLEHFKHPHNVGVIKDADAKATEGSPACGDIVTLYLKVDEKTHKIKDIKFESYGCASNIATASVITDLVKGKTIEEAKAITWKKAADELGGLPPIKMHCSVLAVDTLRSAILNYEEIHGLIKDKKPTSRNEILDRIKHVMNPIRGEDIVKTGTVQDVIFEKGNVTVLLNLEEDNQFAANISEEIIEQLQSIWDIKKINIKFTI
ncbi:iron-sulfur cluster assembly scaffold protein [candidate division WOR-3 bacterium]|nr:iron-sulfur cluster assembly scaffold protein [candidate division WOR-3 bacterium]